VTVKRDSTTPIVTVGIPVYNGERFLSECLESLLDQDYRDFELLVSDNGSTDSTPDIVRRFERLDSRVQLVREEVNRGAAWNYNRLVGLARGSYFAWAPHDDVHSPRFLRRCVEQLDRDRSLVLCQGGVTEINAAGRPLHHWTSNRMAEEADPAERFGSVLDRYGLCFYICGVIRTEALRRTAKIGPYSGSDIVLLAELALHGRFGLVEESLFLHREHADRSVRRYSRDERSAWFSGTTQAREYPTWRLGLEFRRVLKRHSLSVTQRAQAERHIARWAWRHRQALVREAPPLRVRPRVQPAPSADQSAEVHPAGDLSRQSDPSVSLVTTLEGTEDSVGRALSVLAEQARGSNVQLVIVDSGQPVHVRLVAEAWVERFAAASFVSSATQGRPRLTAGIEAATGDVLVLHRMSRMPVPGWLEQLVSEASQPGVVVHGMNLDPRGRPDRPLLVGGAWRRTLPDCDPIGNIAARRDTLESLRGSDAGAAGLDSAYGLMARVRSLGLSTRAVPEAVTVRRGRLGLRTYLREHRHLGLLAASMDRTHAGGSSRFRSAKPRRNGQVARRGDGSVQVVAFGLQSLGWLVGTLRPGCNAWRDPSLRVES
jgi:glycosyltransferase involved in cell wall biosynthesis